MNCFSRSLLGSWFGSSWGWRRFVLVIAAVVAVFGPGATGRWGGVAAAVRRESADPQVVERFYVIELAGQRAGSMRGTETRENDRISTRTNVSFELARGPVKVKIKMQGEFIETAAGQPVSMRSISDTAGMTVEQLFTFHENDVEVTTTQAGTTRTSRLPLPDGSWLTPAAAERYIKQRRESGAEEISMRIIDPQIGLTPVTSRHYDFAPATLTIDGMPIEVTKAKVEMSNAPGIISTEFVDAEGVLVRSETDMGGMTMVMAASTEAEAGVAIEAPEIMLSTFVTPDRKIRNPRSLVRAEYVVSVDGGELPDFPVTGTQRFERIDARSATITVDMTNYSEAPLEDTSNANYLGSSAALDTQDDEVRSITARAIAKAGDDDIAKARAVRRFVYRYIKEKNLGVGFATASEVARTREGDCSEHGVLTAAMLRAADIPSRVVAGLVYADSFAGANDIFGYHMWTQALLTIDGEKRWVDLDATFPASVHYDATHIAIAVSAMQDGDGMSSMAALASVLGRLKIEVVDLEYEGRSSERPRRPGAEPAGAAR